MKQKKQNKIKNKTTQIKKLNKKKNNEIMKILKTKSKIFK